MENMCTNCPVLERWLSCPYKGRLSCADDNPPRRKLRKGDDSYEEDNRSDS